MNVEDPFHLMVHIVIMSHAMKLSSFLLSHISAFFASQIELYISLAFNLFPSPDSLPSIYLLII